MLQQIKKYDIKNILYIDDATYSGRQMSENVSNLSFDLMEKEKENITFHLIIPYISNKFQNNQIFKRLIGVKHTVKLYYNEIMESCNKLIPFENQSEYNNCLKKLKLDFNGPSGNILYYFDHKLADYVSIPSFIFAAHLKRHVPTFALEKDRIKFSTKPNPKYPKDLQYCDGKSKDNLEDVILIDNCQDIKFTGAATYECPPAFYKNKWKERRIVLEDITIWDELKE